MTEVEPLALPDVAGVADTMTQHVTNPRGAKAAVRLAAPLIGATYIDWAADRLRADLDAYRLASEDNPIDASGLPSEVVGWLRDLARQLREASQ